MKNINKFRQSPPLSCHLPSSGLPFQLVGRHQRAAGERAPQRSLKYFLLFQWPQIYNVYVASMFKLILFMSLLAHWSGCLQFLIPAVEGFPPNSWVAVNELEVDRDSGLPGLIYFTNVPSKGVHIFEP